MGALKCNSYSEFEAGECEGDETAYYGDNYGGVHTGNFYLDLYCVDKRCESNVEVQTPSS